MFDEMPKRLSILKLVTLEAASVDENLIEMKTRVKDLKLELQIESGGVRMIGIWGVGGGGKTTLASSIYDEISSKYDGCCFLNNIREESSKNGLETLKEKMLSGLFKQKQVVMARLRHKKVLIFLDDVDRLDQLKTLVGSRDWFGEGTRIIITTRDEHLLNSYRVDLTHHINLLNNDEAVKLFSKHAHRDYTPMEDSEQLLKDVVSYAGGLPLALTVLGSFLCDKDVSQWKSALARLKEIPDEDIIGKLKINFDGLKSVEKDLFLEIACFFRWRRRYLAMKLLDACGFHPVVGVEVLRQKTLITISEDGTFDMHDLVQEMGHYIVKGEHPKNPEKHTRVWKREDVLKILAIDATANFDNIEAIDHRYLSSEESHRGSISIQQLWEGYKDLPNLTHMELGHMANLIKTPDFAGLVNLETFELYNCPCLEEIHPSVGQLEKLVFLSIERCPRLRKFPSICRTKKLETLIFEYCEKIEIISEIQQQEMDNLPHGHHVVNSSEEIASREIKKPNFFVNLLTCGCIKPRPLPDIEYYIEPCTSSGSSACSSPHNNRRLWFLHNALRKLNLSRCSLGDKEIGSGVWELPNLEVLNLNGNTILRLDFSILVLPRLKWLSVSDCKRLVELSELPSSIVVIMANRCRSLESFGDISNCKWLWNGNAIEDYFISVALKHQLPNGIVHSLFSRGDTFRLHLPDGWYNDYCGFLICIVTDVCYPVVKINIGKEDPPFDLSHEPDEAVEPEYGEKMTCIGYISFNSLRHTTLLTSSYNVISVTLTDFMNNSKVESMYTGIELVPRKSTIEEVQHATNCSEFWDKRFQDLELRTFVTRKCDSLKSSIEIFWKPYFGLKR
ncbi:hypothetical protein LXL04_026311 [Taraxacum kok-saghyz]